MSNHDNFFSEGTTRTQGKDARRMNIRTIRILADSLKATLGPRGMDKMLVDSLGDTVITNDGATILREMDVNHPVANTLVDIARTQEIAVGDGTTTAAVITGELLKNAETLLDQDIHPAIISNGYYKAHKEVQKIIDEISFAAETSDHSTLLNIAKTSMTGKAAENDREYISSLVVDAAKMIYLDYADDNITMKDEYIKLLTKEGASVKDTELIKGVVLEKERVHQAMPRKIENAKMVFLNFALEINEKEVNAQIQIDPSLKKKFINDRKEELAEIVGMMQSTGANVVFSTKNIDDIAQSCLINAGMFAVRRVRKSDFEKLLVATGGKLINNIEEIEENCLGRAEIVEELKVNNDVMIFVRECKDPRAVTILIRGETKIVVEELERTIEDCLGTVISVMEDKKVVPGGGAVEIELAEQLREFAKTVGGKEQLAVEVYAAALEVIPRVLAENAGLDSVDMLINLRAENRRNGRKMGLDVYEGKVVDMYEKGVIEPARTKKVAIDSASQVSLMILRIDDIIAAAKLKRPSPEDMIGRR